MGISGRDIRRATTLAATCLITSADVRLVLIIAHRFYLSRNRPDSCHEQKLRLVNRGEWIVELSYRILRKLGRIHYIAARCHWSSGYGHLPADNLFVVVTTNG